MEQKLERAMEIIEKADEIMAEEGVTEEVRVLEKELTEITGRRQNIEDYRHYSAVTSLEEIARAALMPEPQEEESVTEEKLREVVLTFLKKSESEQGYWLKWLKANTGCGSDYLFYPELVGLPKDASMEQIAERIIEEWKKRGQA
ncbi:MAG: hypothetical protein NC337_00610 [Roseburia sp.]|nr:hypothetical protein [Roseburia sp.]